MMQSRERDRQEVGARKVIRISSWQVNDCERMTLMCLQCASNFKTVHYSAIHECFVDGRGHLYHYQYGIQTENLRPPVSFIPTIVINKVI